MSENNNVERPAPSDEVLKARRFRFIFHGRFSPAESTALLEHHEYDLGKAANFVFTEKAEDVSKLTRTLNKDVVEEIQKDAELTNDELVNGKQTRLREFACNSCDRVWWRRVPERKQVSRCYGGCKQRYDPVPKNKEFGWALYNCPNCGNQFSGFGQVGVDSPCFQCNCQVSPSRINPPTKRGPAKSRQLHECAAGDCWNTQPRRQHAFNAVRRDGNCAHPKSRKRRVIDPSLSIIHTSTGSTISTFLTQDDLEKDIDLDVETLDAISEHSDSSDDSVRVII